MVQIFQSMLDYSFFGVFLLRIGLAVWFLASCAAVIAGNELWNGAKIKNDRTTLFMGWLDGLVALLFILGALTQLAALLGALLSMRRMYKYGGNATALSLFILLTLSCIALITLGPGPFSFDLPL